MTAVYSRTTKERNLCVVSLFLFIHKNAEALDIQLKSNYNIAVIYSSAIFFKEACTIDENLTTLDQIHEAAKAEFLQKATRTLPLRNIVKSLGKTLGSLLRLL